MAKRDQWNYTAQQLQFNVFCHSLNGSPLYGNCVTGASIVKGCEASRRHQAKLIILLAYNVIYIYVTHYTRNTIFAVRNSRICCAPPTRLETRSARRFARAKPVHSLILFSLSKLKRWRSELNIHCTSFTSMLVTCGHVIDIVAYLLIGFILDMATFLGLTVYMYIQLFATISSR